MKLPDKQPAIAETAPMTNATHITPDLSELIYYLCQRISILESQVSDLKRQNRQIIHTQEIQQRKIAENQVNIQEIGESFDTVIPHYRYLKDRNADLEALERFHYPED